MTWPPFPATTDQAAQAELTSVMARQGIATGGLNLITQIQLAVANLLTQTPPVSGLGVYNVLDPAYSGGLPVNNGVIDASAAAQAVMDAAPARSIVWFPPGTYSLSVGFTAPHDNVLIYAAGAKFVAADGSDYSVMISAANRTGVMLYGADVDANGSSRSSAQTMTLNCVSMGGTTDSACVNVTVRNSRGYGLTSATAMAASGVTRFTARGCHFLDCGVSATANASDGLFVRGDGCLIDDCQANAVTDTAFVLEGCNYSGIVGCTATNCTSIGGISNDTAADCVGNYIDGLSGSALYVGSTGGVVTLVCFDAGNLRACRIANVTVTLSASATSLGPLIQIRHTSTGRVIGCTLDSPIVDYNGVSGVMAQAIIVSDCDDITINTPQIRGDAAAQGIRFDGACVNGMVTGGYVSGGNYGVLVKDTSSVVVRDMTLKGQATYGLYAADTSGVSAILNTISGAGTASTFSDAGATLTQVNLSDIAAAGWTAYTPTYSSDIGNAGATFTATPTTTLARYRKLGQVAFVTINYAATLKNVSPGYIDLTLPSAIVPANSNTYNPTPVLNDTTWETGIARVLATGAIRVYRANLSNYSTNAAVAGEFTISFEIT